MKMHISMVQCFFWRRPVPAHFTDDYLLYLLAKASSVVSDEFHAALKPKGISVAYWRVLATLADRNGMTIGALADTVLQQQPTVTKIVARMEHEGLVRRRKENEDRRIVTVEITPEGRRMVGDLLADAKRHEANVLSSYSADESRQLKQTLKDLIDRQSG